MPTVVSNTVAGTDLVAALGGAPGVGDTVVINTGSESYLSNLTISNAIANLIFAATYAGDIASAPLKADIQSGGKVVIESNSRRLRLAKASAAWTGAKLEMRSSACTLELSDCSLPDALVAAGTMIAETDADVDIVRVQSGRAILRKSSQTTTTANVERRGYLEAARPITTLNIAESGTCVYSDEAASPSSAATVNVRGRLQYDGGTITQLNLYPGGVLDLSRLRRALTITNAEIHEGSEIIPPPIGITVTWTNPATIVGRGAVGYASVV